MNSPSGIGDRGPVAILNADGADRWSSIFLGKMRGSVADLLCLAHPFGWGWVWARGLG
jgi:hypothetical protein